jgi:hypothetical protein
VALRPADVVMGNGMRDWGKNVMMGILRTGTDAIRAVAARKNTNRMGRGCEKIPVVGEESGYGYGYC